MSAELSLQQAGADAPAVSAPRLGSRPGAELAAALAEAVAVASEHEDSIVLDAEKLKVYALALELHAFAASKVPTLSRVLKDQLERASLSVVLNIAEAMCSQCLQEIKTFRRVVAARRKWLMGFEFGGR